MPPSLRPVAAPWHGAPSAAGHEARLPGAARPEYFEVIHKTAVPVHEHADATSRKLGSKQRGEVIAGLGWDASGEWQRVAVDGVPGEDAEGWVRVLSECGALLKPLTAPDRVQLWPSAPGQVAAAPSPLGPAGAGFGDIAAMLEMKRQLDDQLASMGVPVDGPPPRAERRGRRRRLSAYAAYALQRGLVEAPGEEAMPSSQPAPSAPRTRQERGQWYEVVFSPKVAIRRFPALDAPVLRSAFRGCRLLLYEWDHTRRWRRCNTLRAVDPGEELEENGVRLHGTVRSDGWMMVDHPNFGILLEAVPGGSGDHAFPAADGELCDAESVAHEPSAAGGAAVAAQPDATSRLRLFRQLEDDVLRSVDDRPGLEEPRLVRAVRAGSYDLSRSILSCAGGYYEHPDVRDGLGQTALFEACASERVDLVALLLLCRANPEAASQDGWTPLDLATGPLVKAVLVGWGGGFVDRGLLSTAISRAHPMDRRRLAATLAVAEKDLALEETHAEAPQPRGLRHPRAAARDAEADRAPKAVAAGSVGAPAPALHRVVYKMVAVRARPDTQAPSLRAKKFGEEVQMYEWDETRRWRRVRVVVPADHGDGSVTEVDGWMLLRSEKYGALLCEITGHPEERVDEDDDQEAAG